MTAWLTDWWFNWMTVCLRNRQIDKWSYQFHFSSPIFHYFPLLLFLLQSWSLINSITSCFPRLVCVIDTITFVNPLYPICYLTQHFLIWLQFIDLIYSHYHLKYFSSTSLLWSCSFLLFISSDFCSLSSFFNTHLIVTQQQHYSSAVSPGR